MGFNSAFEVLTLRFCFHLLDLVIIIIIIIIQSDKAAGGVAKPSSLVNAKNKWSYTTIFLYAFTA